MRGASLAIAVACLAAGAAHAEDPVDWTGFYAGLDVGYQWSHRIGKNFNAVTGSQLGTYSESTSEGVFAGPHFGYDYMFGSRIVLGGELDVDRSWKRDQQYGYGVGTVTSVQTRQVGMASLRARLGYAFSDWPLLPYVTAGVNVIKITTTRTQLVGTGGGLTAGMSERASATNGAPTSVSASRRGWAGAGRYAANGPMSTPTSRSCSAVNREPSTPAGCAPS